jgi:hypothetical protein
MRRVSKPRQCAQCAVVSRERPSSLVIGRNDDTAVRARPGRNPAVKPRCWPSGEGVVEVTRHVRDVVVRGSLRYELDARPNVRARTHEAVPRSRRRQSRGAERGGPPAHPSAGMRPLAKRPSRSLERPGQGRLLRQMETPRDGYATDCGMKNAGPPAGRAVFRPRPILRYGPPSIAKTRVA